jgi:hypothetical protein
MIYQCLIDLESLYGSLIFERGIWIDLSYKQPLCEF